MYNSKLLVLCITLGLTIFTVPFFGDTVIYPTVNDLTATFSIPGGASIHQATIDIDTNETTIDVYSFDYDITHSGTAVIRDMIWGDSSYNWDLSGNGDDNTFGVNLALSTLVDPGDSTKIIRLIITANPDTTFAKGTFTSTYTWQFMITDPSAATHNYNLEITATNTTGGAVTFPEVNVRQGVTDLPDGTGSYDFGSVVTGSPTAYTTFTIENTGTANLSISSVNLTSGDTGDFDIDTSLLNVTVPSGTATTFTVRFNPISTGSKTATVTVVNNDLLEGTYTFTVTGTGIAPVPEINIRQGSTNLPDGTGSYDFGSTTVGTPTANTTFTIENTGTADLTISSVTLSGDTADFDLSAATPFAISAGSSTVFTLRFDPVTAGSKTATVSLANNDSDENPYTFTVTGSASPAPVPEINVRQGSTNLPDGTGNYDFGSTTIGTPTVYITFTIENTGTADLTVSSVTLSGDTADFDLSAATPFTIVAGSSTGFTLRFDPVTAGSKTATVSLANNDSDENPYTLTLNGTATALAPEINLQQGATDLADSTGFYAFAHTLADGNNSIASGSVAFTIQNIGTGNLTVSSIALTAGDTGHFDLTLPVIPATIAAGSTLNFGVQFDPLASGARAATVTINNNDSDENPYTFAVTGNALPMDKLVFPPTHNLPWEHEPAIDGVVDQHPDPTQADEVGWNSAFRLTFENGTNPQMAFQGLRHRSNPLLYLSFEVKNDSTFDDEDLIILNFRPNQILAGQEDKDLRIFIYPLYTGQGAKDLTLADQVFEANPANAKHDRPCRLVRFFHRELQPDSSWDWVEIHDVDQTNFLFKAYSWQTGGGAGYAWNVEMQVPRAITRSGAAWINLQNDFLFYFDVVRINSTYTSTQPAYATQYVWPRNLPEEPHGDLENTYEFPAVFWGDASVNNTGQCKGVWIERSGVGVLNDPCQTTGITAADLGNQIELGTFNAGGELTTRSLNRLVATVKNTSEKIVPDGGGSSTLQPVAAENIKVRFRIAHWGASLGTGADWRVVDGLSAGDVADPPFPALPTCPGGFTSQSFTDTDGWVPAANVPAASGSPLVPGVKYFFYDWVISGDETSGDVQYYKDVQSHHCLYVEVDAVSNTDIITRSVWKNMRFVEASTYSDIARISTSGCGKPPAGKDKHTVILQTRSRNWVSPKNLDPTGAGEKETSATRLSTHADLTSQQVKDRNRRIDSYLEYIVDAYYDTGRFVIINDKKYPLYQPLGSFGYIAHHDGPVVEWRMDLGGARKVKEGLYTLAIPADSFVDIKPRLESVEPARFAVSLHGGVSVPLRSLANDYRLGINATLDAEYMFLPRLSLAGLFGINFFLPGNSTVDELYLLTASASLRYHQPLIGPSLSLFIGAGGGLILPFGGTPNYGLLGEAGLDWQLTPRLTCEAAFRYHQSFDMAYMFYTADLGLLFKF